jgi:hypothetical protein
MIWLIVLVFGLGIALAVVGWRLRRERHRLKLRGPIALLGPLVVTDSRPLPRPTMARRTDRSDFTTPTFDPFEQPHQPTYAPLPPPPEPAEAPVYTVRSNGNGDSHGGQGAKRAADRTLQFLPGRFEVVAGRGLDGEIRFVRTAGPDGASVTFGRSEGPAYRHVQLDVPTVSRKHARMRWDGARWSLTNLSATNPVSVNGVALPGEGSAIDLADGDRIEMGEVTFRFHAQ